MDSAIGETKDTIRNSLTRSGLGGIEIGCSDPAIEQGRKLSDLSIDKVVLHISRFIL